MADKGWIGVDLDGTLAEYDGWKGETHIGDPIPAMVQRVKEALADGKTVRIFTARMSNMPNFHIADAIYAWCEQHIGVKLLPTCIKDFECIEIWDDRAVQVIKNTGEIVRSLVDKIQHFYLREPCGGCLHIVLDDQNVTDENIAFCIMAAYQQRDWEALEIISAMAQLTVEQRETIVYSGAW
jgi:hypothetical protein